MVLIPTLMYPPGPGNTDATLGSLWYMSDILSTCIHCIYVNSYPCNNRYLPWIPLWSMVEETGTRSCWVIHSPQLGESEWDITWRNSEDGALPQPVPHGSGGTDAMICCEKSPPEDEWPPLPLPFTPVSRLIRPRSLGLDSRVAGIADGWRQFSGPAPPRAHGASRC